MLPLVFPLIAAAAPVTALIGTNPVRFFRHGEAPQDVEAPYCTWSVPGGAPQNTFEGAAGDVFRVQVDCWADDDTEVETLARAVRAALEPAAHLTDYFADDRSGGDRFRIGFGFDFILSR